MTKINITRKLFASTSVLIILIFPLFIKLTSGTNNIETSQSFCPFKMITGMPCPGCGITKSLIFLYEGDLLKSISYHLFGPLVFLFGIIIVIVSFIELLANKEVLNKIYQNKKLGYAIGTTLFVYHFIRVIVFISINNIDYILQESIWK